MLDRSAWCDCLKATACLFSLSSTLPPQIVASSLSVAVFSSSDISTRSTSRTGHCNSILTLVSSSLVQATTSRQITTRQPAFILLVPATTNLSANNHTYQPRFHCAYSKQQPLGKYPHSSASLSLSLSRATTSR